MYKLRSSSSSIVLRNIKNIIISNNNNVHINKSMIRNSYCSISSLNYNHNNHKTFALSSSSSLLRNVRNFSVITEPLESLGILSCFYLYHYY